MSQIHIDKVVPKGNLYPMFVNFQNGYPTKQFAPYECTVYNNAKNDTKTVATVIDNLIYAGDENVDLEKTFILARNKKTGKVRLIESGVVNLTPILESTKAPEPQLLVTNNLELSRKFGSKKHKKKMEQREKLKVNVDTVTEQMQKVTKVVSKDELDLSEYNKTDNEEFYIPRINRSAKTVEGVYDIDEILTEEQYAKIYSELEGKDYEVEFLPIVKNIVAKKKLSQKHLILAVYANYLFKLYNTVVREIRKKNFTPCAHSVTLSNIILANFISLSSGNTRSRSPPLKDKSLCYAIVFLLLINNYKFEINPLLETAKITQATAALKIRVTGASIASIGDKKIVQLKLPLNQKAMVRRKSTKF